ncbi:hypothetical protein CPB86DRAFT_588765 [Serendipita vermifera]|nr:hypothetical protein CPB86DRAFT_588765 [Serendipita vermifera]
MSTLFNSTILWTSPLINYQPVGQWTNGRIYGNGNASLEFWGTGIQLFGHANMDAYQIYLDGQTRLFTQRRWSTGEIPVTDNDCQSLDRCLVLFETFDLNPNDKHVFSIISQLVTRPQLGKIDLVALTTVFNAQVPTGTNFTQNVRPANGSDVSYQGSWSSVGKNETSMTSTTTGDNVNFTFDGYAISIVGSNEFGTSSYEVNLDGLITEIPLSGSQDNQRDLPMVLWQQSGLKQGVNHTITMKNTASAHLTITSFTVTSLESSPSFAMTSSGPPSWLSTAVPPPTPSTQAVGQSQTSRTEALSTGAIIGIVVGAVALIAIIAFIWMFIRTRRKRIENELQPYGSTGNPSAPAKTTPPLVYHKTITPFQQSNNTSTTTTNVKPKAERSIHSTKSEKTNKSTSQGTSPSSAALSRSTTSHTSEKRTHRSQNQPSSQPSAVPVHSEKRRMQPPGPEASSASQSNANNVTVLIQSRDEKVQLNRAMLSRTASSGAPNRGNHDFRTIEPADRYR